MLLNSHRERMAGGRGSAVVRGAREGISVLAALARWRRGGVL